MSGDEELVTLAPTGRWHDWLAGLAAVYTVIVLFATVEGVPVLLGVFAVLVLVGYYQYEAWRGRLTPLMRATLQTCIVVPGIAATVILVRDKLDFVLGDELAIWPGSWQMWVALPFAVATFVLAMYLPETWSDARQARKADRMSAKRDSGDDASRG